MSIYTAHPVSKQSKTSNKTRKIMLALSFRHKVKVCRHHS